MQMVHSNTSIRLVKGTCKCNCNSIMVRVAAARDRDRERVEVEAVRGTFRYQSITQTHLHENLAPALKPSMTLMLGDT